MRAKISIIGERKFIQIDRIKMNGKTGENLFSRAINPNLLLTNQINLAIESVRFNNPNKRIYFELDNSQCPNIELDSNDFSQLDAQNPMSALAKQSPEEFFK